MRKNKKTWIAMAFSIGTALLVGAVSAFLIRKGMPAYDAVPKSRLTPPDVVFPIVWSILYILMGIGAARVWLKQVPGTRKALTIYGIQLVVNFFWGILFFNLQRYFLAFLWLLLLWVLILLLIRAFYKIDRPAAYLQIPYLLWITFAGYLNWVVWWLNR